VKICPDCSQIANEDEVKCSWCGHELTDQNVFVLQRTIRKIHNPISPRCPSCQSRLTKFMANAYSDFPVRSTYQCQSCQNMVHATNYMLTIIKTFGKLLRFILEGLGYSGGGGG
jgi:hypothetical protein